MEVVVLPDEREIARRGAWLVVESLRSRAQPVLLAATGRSPMALYAELANLRQRDELETGTLRVAQLDEYVGVARDDPRSLLAWMMRAVADPLGVPQERVFRLPSDEREAAAPCREYEAALQAAGGIDVAILGLGPNGHLGFNEPGSASDSATRVVDLAPESIASNATYWDGLAVPHRAVTVGMRVILGARRVLLLVLGEGKRAILRRVLDGPVDSAVPASFLRDHPDAILLADGAAIRSP